MFIKQVLIWLGIFIGPAFFFSSIYIFVFDKRAWSDGGWFGIPMGIFFAWFMIYVRKFAFEKYRPLEIDENGICAMASGKVWKSIAWSDVQRIEKNRVVIITELGFRYGYEFLIVGSHEQIQLDDTIYKLPKYEKYPAILDTLNFYVQQHNILLVAYDRGEDTKKKIKAAVMDKQQRKKLLKEGIKTSITSL